MSNKEARQRLEQTALPSLTAGKQVVVGLSGGADSVALTHFLWENGVELRAAHLNHGLRGAESERDEAFVRDFCAKRGIPLRVKRLNIAALARESGLGLEECGRRERYAFFEEVRAEWAGGEVLLATAHTLSDNLETLLFRLARGTALDGLCGIPEQRGSIIRPFIRCTREEIEEYCLRKELDFVTDSTNTDKNYARNRLRAEAVPALKAVNSAAERHAGQLIESLCADRDFLNEQAEKLYQEAKSARGLFLVPLSAAHRSLTARAVAFYLRDAGFSPDAARLNAAIRLVFAGNGCVNLPRGEKLRACCGILYVERETEKREEIEISVQKDAPPPVCLAILPLLDGKKARLEVRNAKDIEELKKIYKNDLIFCLNYDTIIGKLRIRHRLAGDQVVLTGRVGSHLLKKLFGEAGLTLEERRNAWILADEKGVLWAEPFWPAARAIPNPATEKLLLLTREGQQEGVKPDEG